MDLAVGDVLLELGQRRARVGPVEAADRHHRVLGRELVARRGVGSHRRRDPGVRAGVLVEQRDHLVDAVLPSSSPPAPPAAGTSLWHAGRASAASGRGTSGTGPGSGPGAGRWFWPGIRRRHPASEATEPGPVPPDTAGPARRDRAGVRGGRRCRPCTPSARPAARSRPPPRPAPDPADEPRPDGQREQRSRGRARPTTHGSHGRNSSDRPRRSSAEAVPVATTSRHRQRRRPRGCAVPQQVRADRRRPRRWPEPVRRCSRRGRCRP